MTNLGPLRDSVLRIGEVTEVNGRTIQVRVDKNKNASDLLFDGDVLKNISVNGYVAIRKGFTTLIGKVEGERLDDSSLRLPPQTAVQKTDKNRRFLSITLVGFIDLNGQFRGGLRELPLIGNEVFLVTRSQIQTIHELVEETRPSVSFAVTDAEGFEIAFPVDGLFNSHIAIFGNTGSGKSNTLARMYSAFVAALSKRNKSTYKKNVRIVLLDFNGEYSGEHCITKDKKVYKLSTNKAGDRIPIPPQVLSNIEMLSILSDATEKTQKPFLRRAISLYESVFSKSNPKSYFRAILKNNAVRALQMSDKQRADTILDYFGEILGDEVDDHDVRDGLEWHNTSAGFYKAGTKYDFYAQKPELIPDTNLYCLCDSYEFDEDLLTQLVDFMYIQLVNDMLSNRAQNEHIAPVINRLIGRRKDIDKLFDTTTGNEFWSSNFVVISLDAVNLDMRKTIPLLLAKKLYQEHKATQNKKALIIIVDEAHNILSTESARESEEWKDYRLETFEEIIKEGRKFGVFLTISSQRPNDISPTITSQAHNYFIHRLVNQKDLASISSAVSYLDKLSEEAIPTLPTGTCIFSGVAGQMPMTLRILPLTESVRPRSSTLSFEQIVKS